MSEPLQEPSLALKSTAAFRAADATADPATKDDLLHRAQSLAGQGALADAYAYLQKAVGLIAVTLPFVVAVGHLLSGEDGLTGSISSYYYTRTGNYFVGSLFALGVFFLSYNYKPLPDYRIDNVLSNVASIMAIGVALLPTASDVDTASAGSRIISTLHLVCAGVLFVLLAVFSLFLFTKTDDPPRMKPSKRRRNRVYRICGAVIAVAIVAIAILQFVHVPRSWHALFWLESIAVVAFGVSWLVKGGFMGWFADR